MLSKRYFGKSPGKSLRITLGLDFPAEVYLDAGKWYGHARTVLGTWMWKRPAGHCWISEQVCHVPACSSRPEQSGLLLDEAYRAGLRVWLAGVFGAEVPIKTPEDLRAWAALQLTAIRICDDAYPVHLCKAPQQLYDADLLRIFGVLVLDCVPSVSPEQRQQLQGQSDRLQCFRPNEEDRACYTDSSRLSEEAGFPVPCRPTPDEYHELVAQAWDYLREVGHSSKQATPPGPPEVRDAAGCIQALDSVRGWCEATDGGLERAKQGQRLTDLQQRILTALLEMKATSYGQRKPTQKVAEKATGKELTPDSFKKPISDLAKNSYVATHKGRGGGVWLTEKGRAKAEEIARSDPA